MACTKERDEAGWGSVESSKAGMQLPLLRRGAGKAQTVSQ
jgi:hypothetical protein